MAWWSTILATGMEITNRWMKRNWDEQSKDEASVRNRAEKAAKEIQQAKEDIRRANIDGDLTALQDGVDRRNRWTSELNRLRNEASAKLD